MYKYANAYSTQIDLHWHIGTFPHWHIISILLHRIILHPQGIIRLQKRLVIIGDH